MAVQPKYEAAANLLLIFVQGTPKSALNKNKQFVIFLGPLIYLFVAKSISFELT